MLAKMIQLYVVYKYFKKNKKMLEDKELKMILWNWQPIKSVAIISHSTDLKRNHTAWGKEVIFHRNMKHRKFSFEL